MLFKNKREIYKALAEREKLCIINSKTDTAIMREDGEILDENGGIGNYVFANPGNWELVKPKVKLYAYTVRWNRSDLGASLRFTEDLKTLNEWGVQKPKKYTRLPGLDQEVDV